MEKEMKKRINKQLNAPLAVILIAALLLIVTVFLPYATATAEYAQRLDQYPDSMEYEVLGITARDMKHVSILEFTRIYTALCEQLWHDSAYGIFYTVIICLLVGLPVITGLFALGRKPIGVMIFDLLAFAVFQIQNKDYTMRGIVPGDHYNWGIAHYIFPVAAVLVFAGAVWMLVKKIQIKKALQSQTSAPQSEGE